MQIGYARVSTDDQDTAVQAAALMSAGCERIYRAKASGGLQSRHLDGGVLIVGRDSGVADLHCSHVSPIDLVTQYFLQREKPSKSTSGRLLRLRKPSRADPLVRHRAGYQLPNDIATDRYLSPKDPRLLSGFEVIRHRRRRLRGQRREPAFLYLPCRL